MVREKRHQNWDYERANRLMKVLEGVNEDPDPRVYYLTALRLLEEGRRDACLSEYRQIKTAYKGWQPPEPGSDEFFSEISLRVQNRGHTLFGKRLKSAVEKTS